MNKDMLTLKKKFDHVYFNNDTAFLICDKCRKKSDQFYYSDEEKSFCFPCLIKVLFKEFEK